MEENKNEEVKNTSIQVQNANVPQEQEQQQPKSEIQLFGDNWRIASQLAKSTIIPDNYKGKPENVVIALGMAQKMDIDPFTVMQNLNIVKGKTAWSGSFCRTLIEKSNKFENINLEYVGKKGQDDYGCKVVATRKIDGRIIDGPLVDIKMAKLEHWTTNSKWNSMPELMLSYRALSFFARVHCPEALNGIYTTEEIEDISQVKKVIVADVLE